MSEENTATALGQIGFAAYYERTGGASLKMPESWDMQHKDVRADWEAVGVAIAAHVTTPTAEDFDAAAGTPAIEPPRFAFVEQMGHRAKTGTVREVTFLGRQMLEVTDLRVGNVHLVAPESLYEVTWLSEADARKAATPWYPAAITAGDDDDDDPEVRENGGAWGFTEADL